MTRVDPAWWFEALWVNGERAIPARPPNASYFEATGAAAWQLPGMPLNAVGAVYPVVQYCFPRSFARIPPGRLSHATSAIAATK
jgi:hypothetical protein